MKFIKNLYVDIEKYKIDTDNPENFLKSYVFKKNQITYYDKELTDEQCDRGRGRSFQDLFKLTKTYFPELKLDEFAFIFCKVALLYGHSPENKFEYDKFTLIRCPDIRKVVFHLGTFNDDWNEDYRSSYDESEYEQYCDANNYDPEYVLTFHLDNEGILPYRHEAKDELNFKRILKTAINYEQNKLESTILQEFKSYV